jgi:hypothetical protein
MNALAAWPVWLIILFSVIVIWSAVWKAIALWKSARNNQTGWFVVLCIFNTIGILEIIYLAFCQKDKNVKNIVLEAPVKPAKKKK